MRFTKTLGLFSSAIVLGLVFMAAGASAQVRIGVQFGHPYYRPYVRRYYAPPPPPVVYYGNPYWGHSQRYYDQQALNNDENRLEKDEYKYGSDGYITPQEQEKLNKDRYEVDRDRRRLQNDW